MWLEVTKYLMTPVLCGIPKPVSPESLDRGIVA